MANALRLDTLEFSDSLQEAGANKELADAIVKGVAGLAAKEDLSELEEKITSRFDAMEKNTNARWDAIIARFDAITARLDTMEKNANARFDAMEKNTNARFEAMEKNTANHLDAMEKVTDTRLRAVETTVAASLSTMKWVLGMQWAVIAIIAGLYLMLYQQLLQ